MKESPKLGRSLEFQVVVHHGRDVMVFWIKSVELDGCKTALHITNIDIKLR